MTRFTQYGEVSTNKKKNAVAYGVIISVCVGGWIGISYAIRWALEASQVNNTLAS